MKTRAAYYLLIPACCLFLLTGLFPVVLVGRLSLLKTNFITSKFVGLTNYIKIFGEPEFLRNIVNSFLYVLITVPLVLFLAVTIGLMVINSKKAIQDATRFVFYIPVFAAGIIISTVWRWILQPQEGLANWILSLFGLQSVMWLGSRMLSIIAICLMLTSGYLGASLVIIFASMLSIPVTIYDSARIDGASWFQIKTRIILPIVTPTIFVLSLLYMIGTFQVWETIYLMRPIQAANNLMMDIYLTGFTFSRYGMASAKSIVLMALILSLSLVKKRIER